MKILSKYDNGQFILEATHSELCQLMQVPIVSDRRFGNDIYALYDSDKIFQVGSEINVSSLYKNTAVFGAFFRYFSEQISNNHSIAQAEKASEK